jgi:protein ImuB
MYAVIHLPHFTLQAVLRSAPDLWERPVALVDPTRTTPVVLEATPPAWHSGVERGQTATQALARCTGVLIRHRNPASETAATDVLLQCAYGFSPHLESTAAGLCTLDLRGLSRLQPRNSPPPEPDTLRTWAGELRAILIAQGLRPRIGIGATPNLARHAALFGEAIHVVTDATGFVASLPLSALEPSTDTTRILAGWGLRTVGDLLALDPAELADRLGLEALGLLAAASTRNPRPLNTVRPPEVWTESWDFEDPVETLEPLLFLLNRFTGSLCARLALAARAAEAMELSLRLESGSRLDRRLAIPEPTRDPAVLQRLLSTHLETVRSESAVVGLRLTLETTVPVQRQFGLFETTLKDPRQFQETLGRIAALLGSDRVGTPVKLQRHGIDTFRLAPPEFEGVPPLTQPRPALQAPGLRRLRPAPAATVESLEGRPVSIRSPIAQGRLVVTLGPWRASGHWWESGAWEREEWDATTLRGQVLRLVRQPEGWIVDGLLD